MSPKHEPPNIEVTLGKSPNGVWGAQGPGKRTLQPWQRLWLVSGIIYLLMLAGSYCLLMPTQEQIEQQMVFSVTEELKRFDGMAFAGESPQSIFEIARSQGYASWIAQVRTKYHVGSEGNPGFDKIDKTYRESVSELPVKRVLGVLLCFVLWLLPMGVLYAIGFVVDWIKRGASGLQG